MDKSARNHLILLDCGLSSKSCTELQLLSHFPTAGAPRSKPGSYQPQYVEQPQPSPQQQTGFSGGFPAGAPSFNNGGAPSPQNQDLPQHLYAHQQQQLQPDQSRQMHRSTNGECCTFCPCLPLIPAVCLMSVLAFHIDACILNTTFGNCFIIGGQLICLL